VHAPGSETILGVIDITGGGVVDSPQTIAMVRAAARMAEAELARDAAMAAAQHPEPRRTGAPDRQHLLPEISINGLGRSECVVSIGTRAFRLSPRHSEIMVILAACPGGLTGDELAYLLYPARPQPGRGLHLPVPDAIERTKAVKQGNPLDIETMIGAQEEIFGPVLALTRFSDEADALKIANDTLYGLGAGVWTRDGARAYRAGREIQAGRVWANCYHAYPAHAAFGGYKQSGVGRENHKMMLDHYQQTKNLLVSYSPKKLGFF
jgi:acyl-CoA reductase-like NAD-dependent aldehyde dehydrogenase